MFRGSRQFRSFSSFAPRVRRPAPDWRQRATWGMVLGLFAALLSTLLLTRHPIGMTLERDTMDYWFALRGAQPASEVAILAADDATVRSWNGRPFDPAEIARLLLLLKRSGVRTTVLCFPDDPQASLSLPQKIVLARAMKQNGAVFLGTDGSAANNDILERAAAGIGHLKLDLDGNGRARALPLAARLATKARAKAELPALPLAVAWRVIGGPESLQSSSLWKTLLERDSRSANARDVVRLGVWTLAVRNGALALNYPYAAPAHEGAPASTLQTVSIQRALLQPQLLKNLAGKVVLIGPTSRNGAALYSTPTGQRVPEVELQAIALDNLLTGQTLQPVAPIWNCALTALLCMIVGGFVAARRPLWSGPVALLCLSASALISFGLFGRNLWLDIAPAWLGIALTFLVGVIGRARWQERQATRIGSTIEALTQVSEIIAAQKQPDQLLPRVLTWAETVMRAKGASALLLDESGKTLHFAAATGPKSQELLPVTLQLGQGIAGWVAEQGVPAIVNDTHHDWRFNEEIDERTGFSTQSVLCVPLRVRDKMLGVIEVINRMDGQPFNHADAELLTAVANQAALVLENSRLYAMLNQRVEQSESELARTNQRLQAEKNLMQTVLQSMTDGVVVTDGAGRVQLLNPAAAALLPELEHGSLGQSLPELLPDLGAPEEPEASDEDAALAGANAVRIVNSLLLRGDVDAPRLIEAHSAPLQSAGGASGGTVTVFADVTQERNVERMKSDFVSFVAHEMRSPLTSISGFSSMLQRQELQEAEARRDHQEPPANSQSTATRARFLGIIHDESERLTRLINNLLDVARIESGRGVELWREAFDFAEVACPAADSQRTYSSRHRIVCHPDSDLPPVFADRDKVTQVLINLLSNALKYSPGGTVTVSAHTLPTLDGDVLCVRVQDQGPGIAPEDQARLFERFQRAGTRGPQPVGGPGSRAKPTGTGLGLFLSKHLIEAHDGKIWVESEPGQGAAFCFTLPLAPAPDAADDAPAQIEPLEPVEPVREGEWMAASAVKR